MLASKKRNSTFCKLGAASVLTFLVETSSAQTVPAHAKPSRTAPAATFASSFQNGTPTLNGVVDPVKSVAFPDTPNCSFYQWSTHVLLWATSPVPPLRFVIFRHDNVVAVGTASGLGRTRWASSW
jgi:hypothetical protein